MTDNPLFRKSASNIRAQVAIHSILPALSICGLFVTTLSEGEPQQKLTTVLVFLLILGFTCVVGFILLLSSSASVTLNNSLVTVKKPFRKKITFLLANVKSFLFFRSRAHFLLGYPPKTLKVLEKSGSSSTIPLTSQELRSLAFSVIKQAYPRLVAEAKMELEQGKKYSFRSSASLGLRLLISNSISEIEVTKSSFTTIPNLGKKKRFHFSLKEIEQALFIITESEIELHLCTRQTAFSLLDLRVDESLPLLSVMISALMKDGSSTLKLAYKNDIDPALSQGEFNNMGLAKTPSEFPFK